MSAVFTCKSARSGAVTGLLIMLIAVETGTLHVLLVRFVPLLAYALSATSLSLLLWLIADYRALGRAAVAVESTELRIAIGRRLRAAIPRARIAAALNPTWQQLGAAAPRYLNPTKPATPNVLLVFDSPQQVTLLDALQRQITRLGLHLDDPAGFIAAVTSSTPS